MLSKQEKNERFALMYGRGGRGMDDAQFEVYKRYACEWSKQSTQTRYCVLVANWALLGDMTPGFTEIGMYEYATKHGIVWC